MNTDGKRRTAALLPYFKKGDVYFFYLQKKTKDSPYAPGKYALFGGGIEGEETPEEALIREIQEELCITPHSYQYIGDIETSDAHVHTYILAVEPEFGSTVTVMEGELGRFLGEDEIFSSDDVLEGTRFIVKSALTLFADASR